MGVGDGLAVKTQGTLFWNREVGGGALGILRVLAAQYPQATPQSSAT